MRSSGPAIAASGLGKVYSIGTMDRRPTLLGRLRQRLLGQGPQRELWALRGLDFTVERGEIFGVCGKNGAGKSTLLLLLGGIIAPTEGTLRVVGKTDPFFQLAAGLKPGLTVFDNMRLCAALLGLPRREFDKRLPSILEFSLLEPYLGARLGELSSGLAARVPFSVAIHSYLDVLLIDEMLEIGDASFQKRCHAAFRGLADSGKTLIVVSHSLQAIRTLCGRALYLKDGRQEYLGKAAEAAARFAADCAAAAGD